MRNKIAALVATTAFVAGGTLMTATSASATVDPPGGSWDHTWTTTDANKGGTVYVEENGDVVSVCDSFADGLAARARVSVQQSSGAYLERYTLVASGGLGSCATARASDGGTHDLPEHVSIGVTVYLGPDFQHASDHYYLNDH
ncbi:MULTISPECIES: hypothetical protein [unclassified Amycolatopsis]|uniref:hypothetical protein n=1 Tax=unclassified Amycolatopsis TaxID=2618356 RepID=UPI002E13DCB6|nr:MULTISPECIES: hypothetical protein [unclassified Amycolatopsis]WSK79705.1 hypothetical protein OG570_03675 [Amycolatopsis sp. NBC_01286]